MALGRGLQAQVLPLTCIMTSQKSLFSEPQSPYLERQRRAPVPRSCFHDNEEDIACDGVGTRPGM